MSFALVDRHLDFAALAALVGVRVERDGERRTRLYCPIEIWNELLPSVKERVHASVIELGFEAWCEDACVVFHNAQLPLHRGARRAHARRVAFLLERVPA